jgi:hypothetical protein
MQGHDWRWRQEARQPQAHRDARPGPCGKQGQGCQVRGQRAAHRARDTSGGRAHVPCHRAGVERPGRAHVTGRAKARQLGAQFARAGRSMLDVPSPFRRPAPRFMVPRGLPARPSRIKPRTRYWIVHWLDALTWQASLVLKVIRGTARRGA